MMFKKEVKRVERRDGDYRKTKEHSYIMNSLNYSRDGETTFLDEMASALVPYLKELILESYVEAILYKCIFIRVEMGEMRINFYLDEDIMEKINKKMEVKEEKQEETACLCDKIRKLFGKK